VTALYSAAPCTRSTDPEPGVRPDGPQDASASADPSVMPASWVPPAEADQTVIDCFRLAPYAPVRTDPVLSVREFYARHAAPSPWRLAGWSL
jgi:hypothetical protein